MSQKKVPTKIKDPEFIHFRVFFIDRWLEENIEKAEARKRKVSDWIKKDIEAFGFEADASIPERPSPFVLYPVVYRTNFYSQNIASQPLKTYKAGLFHDCIFVMKVVALKGNFPLQVFKERLKKEMKGAEISEDLRQDSLLAEFPCFVVETEEKLRKEERSDLAEQVIRSFYSISKDTAIGEESAEFDGNAIFLYKLVSPDEPQTVQENWVLILEKIDETDQFMKKFLYNYFPELLLYRSKLLYYSKIIMNPTQQQSILNKISELRNFSKIEDKSLKTLEELDRQINNWLQELNDTIFKFKTANHTLEIAKINTGYVLDTVFKNHPSMKSLFLKDYEFVLFKLSSQLRYREITKEAAENKLNSLLLDTQIRETRWERWTTIILGGFAVFEICFNMPWGQTQEFVRFMVSIAIAAGVSALVYFKDELKSLFKFKK